jgi:hypothetical protein
MAAASKLLMGQLKVEEEFGLLARMPTRAVVLLQHRSQAVRLGRKEGATASFINT